MENNVAIVQDLFRKTKVSIDNLNTKFRYPENIGHLLHLIIPAFILKYGLKIKKRSLYRIKIKLLYSLIGII